MPGRTTRALGVLLLAIGGGAIHPFGTVKQDTRAPLLSNAAIDAANLELIQRSCASCHSDRGQLPWYGHVAPTSWLVEKDVNQARAHLNFSHWPAYATQERITLLSAIGAVLRTNAMPPQRYTALHRDAALSDSERQALYEWTQEERRRLRALSPEK
ncbi:MAG: heme-binding domain-containing protein [Candidatus Solibacter sp.]